MGAWGAKAFENDSALDWFAELEANGVTALRSILSRVADTAEDDYLDVDDGRARSRPPRSSPLHWGAGETV